MRLLVVLLCLVPLSAQEPLPEAVQQYLKWRNEHPGMRTTDQDLALYSSTLAASGKGQIEIDRVVTILKRNVDAISAARWDTSLNDPSYPMNRGANQWLMDAIKSRKPGDALDIGMGTGRNAIYLASLGWKVTGFDVAAKAVSSARERAQTLGLAIDARVSSYHTFDFGREKWDLIVDMYEFQPVRIAKQRIFESLRPGGLWVMEGFAARSPSQRPSATGEGAFGSGELLRLLGDEFKILKYEEVEDRADFGLQVVPLVRVVAQKRPPGPPPR